LTTQKPSTREQSLALALDLARAADSKKAEDIVILDVGPTLGIADFFVICSARSKKQVEVVAEACQEAAARHDANVRPLDGKDSGWVVGDFVDVIVHVFEEERRKYYDLEHLWADAPRVPFEPEVPETARRT
jgi:ribosome-associated protein